MRVAFAFFSGLLLVAPLNAADRPENLVPLMRFYDTKFNEHIYSYSTEEMNKWHQLTHVKEHEIIGDVATSKLPGTVPLWRAVRTENNQSRHYYYLEAVKLPPNTFVDAESFKVYVWTKPGDGRVPIYCTTWIDATDAFMHRELKVVEQNREETEKSTGRLRPGMAGKNFKTPVFYVYPHVAKEKDDPEKPTEGKPATVTSNKKTDDT